jgi:hypothetical protein
MSMETWLLACISERDLLALGIKYDVTTSPQLPFVDKLRLLRFGPAHVRDTLRRLGASRLRFEPCPYSSLPSFWLGHGDHWSKTLFTCSISLARLAPRWKLSSLFTCLVPFHLMLFTCRHYRLKEDRVGYRSEYESRTTYTCFSIEIGWWYDWIYQSSRKFTSFDDLFLKGSSSRAVRLAYQPPTNRDNQSAVLLS